MHRGSIFYTLSTVIDSDPPISSVLPFKIIGFKNHQSDPVSSSISSNVYGCCKLSKGVIIFRASSNKSAYNSCNIIYVNIELDSLKCELTVEKIKVSLTRTIIVRTNKGFSSVIKQNLSCVHVNPPKRDCLLDNNEIEVSFQLENFNEKIKEIWTTKGKLIFCSYSIIVQAQLAKCLFGKYCEDPEIDLAIDINPDFSLINVPEPANWNPTRLRTVIVSNELNR